MTSALIVAAICLCCEALFSGSEIAVVAADRLRIRRRAEEGRRAERLLLRLLATPQRLLTTTLIGTQIAVVTATVTMTVAFSARYPEVRAELYTLAVLTPVLVILGEIVPKSIAQQHADRLAPRVVYVLWFAERLFGPFVWAASALTSRVARWLGVATPGKSVTREELELIMRGASAHAGEITDGERRMISRIFHFGDRVACDVMVPLSSVSALPETATVETAVGEVEDKRFTRFPVYRERVDRVVGMVHTFELLKIGRSTAAIATIMQSPIYVPENQPVVDVLVELQRSRKGMAVVVDEYGGAVGIITVEDILEEIVGEIEDEYDIAPPAIRKEGEGIWRVRARVPIQEVNRELKLELPEGNEYETLAGLMLDQLKHIPHVGESVRIGAVLIKVLEASERAVDEVQIRVGRRRG